MSILEMLFYGAIIAIFYMVFMALQKRKRRVVYNPFALWTMFSRCECDGCKTLFDKPFERFEYAYKKIEELCPTCKKKTKCTILGSFVIHDKTPQELKFEIELEKWYTEYEKGINYE